MLAIERFRWAMAAGVALLAAAAPVQATVRAVTVGVDTYADGKNLAGAVNDAELIRETLARQGVDVIPLLEERATRSSLVKAVRTQIARSQRGDTVLLTIASHGAQLKALDPRTEPDDPVGMEMDEVILFSRANRNDPQANLDQYIRDDDLSVLWQEAKNKNVVFIAVFDTCHSGTAMRGVSDSRAMPGRTRDGLALQGLQFPQQNIASSTAVASDAELPNGVYSYAANLDSQVIREIIHDGKWHGALSVAFAEALNGWAGPGTKGYLNHDILVDYLAKRVNELAATTQTLVWQPGRRDDRPLLPVRTGNVVAGPVGRPALSLRIDGLAAAEAARIAAGIRNVRLVGAGGEADLIWDAAKGDALRGVDVVSTEVDAKALPGLVEKWQTLTWLNNQPGSRLSIIPSRVNAEFPAGSLVGIRIPESAGRTLIMINLGEHGRLDMLYPHFAKEGNGHVDHDLNVPNFSRACPRYGAEHFIAAAADGPPDPDSIALVAWLKRMDGTANSWEATTKLLAWARQRNAIFGHQILVTTAANPTDEVSECARKD